MADGWNTVARWYPDVVAAETACVAWQREFDRLECAVRVRPEHTRDGTHRSAAVGDGEHRHAALMLSPFRRQFRLTLREGRRVLLGGHAPDLAVAAAAARPWLDGQRPGAVAAGWPFLGSVALAEARERRDRREVKWLDLYENHTGDPIGRRLESFVALAFHVPRLRALYPVTSHFTLWFSRTPYPFTPLPPTVEPARTLGRYLPGHRDGQTFDETDAAGALAIVLAAVDG